MSRHAEMAGRREGGELPSVTRCLLLLVVVDLSLRVFGFARVTRFVKRKKISIPRYPDRSLVDGVLRQVVAATAIYPGRSMCLEQSMLVFFLLRRREIDAHLRLGVQHYPFAAHAWVEIDGVAVTESPEVVSRFVLMPEAVV